MNTDCIFIIGSPRGATTSVSKIFGLHPKLASFVEDKPLMLKESRLGYENNSNENFINFIKPKLKRIASLKKDNIIYVDKNPSYLPFCNQILTNLNSKIIFVFRDGKKTVNSMMDWNEYHSKSFYCLDEDWPKNSKEISKRKSEWDFSRPRPNIYSPLFKSWKKMTRFEKCCWYWSKFIKIALDVINKFPDRVIPIFSESISSDYINQKFKDLNLSELNKNFLLDTNFNFRNFNNIQSRFDVKKRFTNISNWNSQTINSFYNYAGISYDKINEYRLSLNEL